MARLFLLFAACLATYVVASPDDSSYGGDDSDRDCPDYTTTTRTKTTTRIAYESTPPIKTWTYPYTPVYIVNVTTLETRLSLIQTTVTSTYSTTATTTVISVSPADTTVTVATASGFTPVLCEGRYFDPTVTVTTTTTTTIPASTTIYKTANFTQTRTATIIDGTTTLTSSSNGTFVTYVFPTVTSTSTRADPTQTVYDACATDNVTPDYPGNGYVAVPYPVRGSTTISYVYSIDETDCCAICQANSTCTGSVYKIQGYGNPQCGLVVPLSPANATCDPRFVGAVAGQYAWFDFPLGPAQVYISNSGCGQIGIQ